jgi:hypothetical protein
MKKLLMALLLFTSFSAFAVPNSCVITNNSTCTVFYELLVSASGTYNCPVGATSTMLVLLAGKSATYYSSDVPGVATGARDFLGAEFFKGVPSCTPNFLSVGASCTGFPLSAAQIILAPSCANCSMVTATWTPNTGTGVSLLQFN